MIKIIPETWIELIIIALEWMVVLLFVLSPRWWYWIFKKTVPNIRKLRRFYCSVEIWSDRARQLWSRRQDEEVAFMGFLAMLLGTALVGLNVLLLGQAMELVATGGRRVSLGWFGKYDALAMVTAIIFILAQVFLGHLSLETRIDPRSKKVKLAKSPGWVAFSLLGLAVVIETVMGTVRAYYLSIGEIPESPTLIDSLMVRGGPFIVGLVSFVVPCAEVAAGVISIDLYAAINWKVWTRRSKALWFWFWKAFLGVFFCYFPEPPTQITMNSDLKRLHSEVEKWNQKRTSLQGAINKLPKAVPAPSPSHELSSICDLTTLEAEIKACCDAVNRGYDDLIQPLRDALDAKSQLSFGTYLGRIRDAWNNVYPAQERGLQNEQTKILNALQSFQKALKGLPNKYETKVAEWNKKISEWNRQIERINNERTQRAQEWNNLLGSVRQEINKWQAQLVDAQGKLGDIIKGKTARDNALSGALQQVDTARRAFETARQNLEAEKELRVKQSALEAAVAVVENLSELPQDNIRRQQYMDACEAKDEVETAQQNVNQLKADENTLNGGLVHIQADLNHCPPIVNQIDEELKRSILPTVATPKGLIQQVVEAKQQADENYTAARTKLSLLKQELDDEWKVIQRTRRSRARLIRWLFFQRDELRLTIPTIPNGWLYIFRLDGAGHLQLLHQQQAIGSYVAVPAAAGGCFPLERDTGTEVIHAVCAKTQQNWDADKIALQARLQQIINSPTNNLYGYILMLKHQPEGR